METFPINLQGPSALFIQGVEIKDTINVSVDVQWDVFDETFSLFS